MQQGFKSEYWDDPPGSPAGGCSYGVGFAVSWQNGPLGRGETRRGPNGAFVEDIIAVAVDRLKYYQASKFKCEANARALIALREALAYLNARTADREARVVEGTHGL